MDGIPILGFAAYSGTGKTTLIEQLVRSLKAQGLRIAVIKHDGHDFEIDREGKGENMRDEQLLAYCRKFRFERKNRADGIRCNQEKKEAGHG